MRELAEREDKLQIAMQAEARERIQALAAERKARRAGTARMEMSMMKTTMTTTMSRSSTRRIDSVVRMLECRHRHTATKTLQKYESRKLRFL